MNARLRLWWRALARRRDFERDMAVVPAGSLDSDPGIAPAGHIFVESKAPWFDITGDVPQFATMPPRR